jgi:multidrug transporter EmrE-like cation transporter
MLLKFVYAGGLLFGAIASQVLAIYLMPMTRGASAFIPTAGVMFCFAIFTVLISRLLMTGFQLVIVVPLVAASVPLGGILVGIFAYGETASLAKVAVLLLACLLVGTANIL